MNEVAVNICGACTLWSLGRTNRTTLKAGFDALDLGHHVPEARSPKAILRDVLITAFQNKSTLVRPLAKRDAFTVVLEKRGQDVNSYDNGYKIEVDAETGRLDVEAGAGASGDISDIRRQLQEAYDTAANVLPIATVGAILAAVVGGINGIPLRPSGGVYWLPLNRLETWSKIAAVVETAAAMEEKSSVYLLRTPADAAALRAVRDALTTQLQSEIAKMEQEVAMGQLGEDALTARVDSAKRMHERLKEYEGLLGENLEVVRGQIDRVRSAAATALIYAAGTDVGGSGAK